MNPNSPYTIYKNKKMSWEIKFILKYYIVMLAIYSILILGVIYLGFSLIMDI